MARKSQAEVIQGIMDKIESRFNEDQPLHDRMDLDYSDWRLTQFVPESEEGIDPEDAYTTNSMRTLADKVESFVSGSEIVVRVTNDAADEQKRAANDNLERLVVGMLRQVNKRLQRKGDPLLIPQLAWYSVVRGGRLAVRTLLRKNPDGETYPEILPLDPRHLVVQYGNEEPIWAAYRMSRTRAQVRNEYNGFEFNDTQMDDDDETEYVYDYYEKIEVDGEVKYMNSVIIDDKYVKKPTDTFAKMFPVCTIAIGSTPMIAPSDTGSRHINTATDVEERTSANQYSHPTGM